MAFTSLARAVCGAWHRRRLTQLSRWDRSQAWRCGSRRSAPCPMRWSSRPSVSIFTHTPWRNVDDPTKSLFAMTLAMAAVLATRHIADQPFEIKNRLFAHLVEAALGAARLIKGNVDSRNDRGARQAGRYRTEGMTLNKTAHPVPPSRRGCQHGPVLEISLDVVHQFSR